MKKKYFSIIFVIFVIVAIFLFTDRGILVRESKNESKEEDQLSPSVNPTEVVKKEEKIVIDAGHGGFDPGKIGVNDAKEKDINLAIALKVSELLEKEGYEVVMVRTQDCGLYEETDKNKKSTDMRNRVKLIEETKPNVAVSIHQNSFTQEQSHGAQVFYYQGSAEGQKFAHIMQETIKEKLNDGNHRIEKANTSYYMLKKSSCPLIIIECGFLSNHSEAALLITDDYQNKMAEAIKQGVINYLTLEEGSYEDNSTESRSNGSFKEQF